MSLQVPGLAEFLGTPWERTTVGTFKQSLLQTNKLNHKMLEYNRMKDYFLGLVFIILIISTIKAAFSIYVLSFLLSFFLRNLNLNLLALHL